MFLLLFSVAANFSPSMYDIVLRLSKERIVNPANGIAIHSEHAYSNQFGDVAILSLNVHTDKDTTIKGQTKSILQLINLHHPSIFALQAASKRLMKNIRKPLLKHYAIACSGYYNVDVTTRSEEYKPIIYDKRSLTLLYENKISPPNKKNASYGSIAVFQVKKNKEILIFINVDLFSGNSSRTSAQLLNIVKHVTSPTFAYSREPAFILGTINTLSNFSSSLLFKVFKNTLNADENNEAMPKTTFHYHGYMDDNVQRDFILLKDFQSKLIVNYSRILSLYNKEGKLYFEHYPLYSIISFRKNSK